MRLRPTAAAAVLALPALFAPPSAAQSGGTPAPADPGPPSACPAAYPGDDAGRRAFARWMARGAAVRDLPGELPVMAGLAESGLRNLNRRGNPYAGFFSMHRSLSAGPYLGFPQEPELQLRWFTDTAIAVRQRAIAEGNDDFGTETAGYGLWIADVERPARENRDGYQPYLDDAEALLPASCRPSSHVVDTSPPRLGVRAARRQRGPLSVRVRCPGEPCMAAARAQPRRRVRVAATASVEDAPVTLTLARRSAGGARLVVEVTAVDEAGNASRARRRVTLLR